MRAIDYIHKAYASFALRQLFIDAEQQILRECTVAQISYRSDSLGLMIKMFVSEMEGEAGIYVAPLGTALGFREDEGWVSPWNLKKELEQDESYDNTSLDTLRGIAFPDATEDIQLQYELDWFVANQQLLVKLFHGAIQSKPA